MAENDRTVIHELGHIFNMLAGAGGSKFLYDVNLAAREPDAQAQKINSDLEHQCIPERGTQLLRPFAQS